MYFILGEKAGMIGKKFQYRGLDLSIGNIPQTNIFITNVNGNTTQRTEIIDNANEHGSISSYTLEGGRLFTFTGYCFGMTKEERGTSWELLNQYINIEPFLNMNNQHLLTFETDRGEKRQCYCQVVKKPEGSNEVLEPRINFTFELYSDSNLISGMVEHTITTTTTSFGGTSFPNNFPDSWGKFAGGANCFNAGNFKAGCLITIVGELVNPRIKNISNGLDYKLDMTTTNLVLDSRFNQFSITNDGADVSVFREYGLPVMLSPGDNQIVVTADAGEAVVTISWYDTRNSF